MKFNLFRLHISAPKINRYLVASTNNKAKAQRLYKANIKVSQSFFPILAVIEIVLRNNLNNVLLSYFADPEWILNQKTGFMSDPSLKYIVKGTGKTKTNNFLKDQVEKAERRIRKGRTVVSAGKVIAEQTFGFWTDLFAVHHYKILKGKPIQIFKYLPSGYGRKEVYDKLNEVRLFRNRIYHNEPVCFDGNIISFQHCEEIHRNIVDIFDWIEPELSIWIKELDSVKSKIHSAKKIK